MLFRNSKRTFLVVMSLTLLLTVGVLSLGAMRPVNATVNTFRPCDVVAGIGFSQFNWLRPNVCPGIPSSLTLVQTISDPSSSFYTTGAAFDVASCESAGITGGIPNPNPGVPCLYATDFAASSVSVFDNEGNFLWFCGGLGAFGGEPESVSVVPSPGGLSPVIVVGNAGSHNIETAPLPCTASSTITQHGPVTTENVGTDWVDMQANKCDVHYTSEGTHVLDFNVCTDTQGSNNASLTGSNGFANKFLVGTGDIVADAQHVSITNGGVESSTCDSSSPGASGLFSMDINPGGNEFAVGSFDNNKIDYITTAHCVAGQASPDATFDAIQGASTSGLYGVAIYGEVTAAVTTSSSTTSSTVGVPEFGAGLSVTLLISAVAFVGLTLLIRGKRHSPIASRLP